MNRKRFSLLVAMLLALSLLAPFAGAYSPPQTSNDDSLLNLFRESKRDPAHYNQRTDKPDFTNHWLNQRNYFATLHANAPRDLVRIWIGDFYVMSDVYPFVENNRTYVPIRFVAEALGYDVQWLPETRQVRITGTDKTITLTLDSDLADVSGMLYTLDAPARARHNRTFVPLRFIAEAFGKKVNYYKTSRVVAIGTGYRERESYPIKYYAPGVVFIPDYKVNFITHLIYLANGRQVAFQNDHDLYVAVSRYIDDYVYDYVYVQPYQPAYGNYVNRGYADTQVAADKRLYDENYVAPDENDPFVGSWYGITRTVGTNDYYDDYRFIQKIGANRYLVTKKAVHSDGSVMVTRQYATYYPERGEFVTERSFETVVATGRFNFSWYETGGAFTLRGFDYMYVADNPKQYLQKY